MMRWATMAALAVAGLAIPPANAAGAMATPAVYSWTSCYVGGNAGAAWGHTDVVDEVDGSPIATLNASGIAGGGQIGCDYQIAPQWVIGVQGLWDATGLSATVYPELLEGAGLHGSIPWFATFTGRIGYLLAPDWMIYAKGGAAWTHTDAELLDGREAYTATSFDQSGWTAGIGAEWKHDQHWSFFTEYDFMGFSPVTPTFPETGDIGTVKQNVQVFLVGVNLHLN